ncbi:uncharacterized protein [Choristoneura fumiferana]|uniref:uncharacterized protein n=1 Tax=Choristoneura fumiferana TaxID=7141 RepID=UPI003D159D31
MYPLLVLLCCSASASIAPTHLFMSRVGPCTTAPKTEVSVSELSITRKNYDFTLSGELNVKANISNGWDIQATMQKCPDIRNLDTCDFYRSFPVVRAGCTTADNEGFETYSMFFHYTQPRMKCPVSEGNYTLLNYPFYMEDNYLAVAETKISTSVFGYTLKLEGYSGEEPLLCLEAYLRLLYIRNHNWLDTDVNVTETTSQEDEEK